MKIFGWVIFSAISLCGLLAAIAKEVPQDSVLTDSPPVSQADIELLNALTRTRDVIELSAEITGAIKSLNVMEGSRIEIGQELGKIKDERASLALEKAVLEWDVADKKQKSDIAVRLADKAALVAATEYERAIRANKEIPNTYAESEVDRRKLVYEKAKLEIEQAAYERGLAAGEASVAKNGLDQAQLELRRHLISSPVNGMVIAVKRQAGEWVEPGMSILEVVDMDFFRVEGFVSIDKAAFELAGRNARIQISFGEDTWDKQGKVVFVSPEANPVNLQVRVIIEVPFSSEKERLSFRSGLKCKAAIMLSRPETNEETSPPEPADK